MKNCFVKIFLGVFLLWGMVWVPAYAANEFTVQYIQQPAAAQGFSGGTLVLQYVAQNTFPQVIPMPASEMIFSTSNSAVFTTQSITDSCNDLIPANGTCVITVTLQKGTSSATATGQLQAYWGGLLIEINNSVIINFSGGPQALSFTQQPTSPQSVTVNQTRNLLYKVNNPNATAVTLTDVSYTSSAFFNPTTPSITPVGTGCSTTNIPANTICSFIIGITGGGTPGVALNQALTLNYAQGPLASNAITVNVNAVQPLTFTDYPTTTQTVNTDGTLNLFYSVQNPNSTSVALSSVAYTTSTLFTPNTPTVSSSTPGCISLNVIPGNTTCIYDVDIIAGGSSGTATNQFLTVTPTVGSPVTPASTISIDVTSAVSGLSLVFSPTAQNMPPSQSQTLTYTVLNSSGSPIAFTPSVTSDAAATATITSTSCSGTVSAGGTCSVVVTINSQPISSDPTSASLTLTIASGVTAPINFNVTNSTTRTVTFVNQCSFPVWFGINPANVNTIDGAATCSNPGTQDRCPSGATCVAVNSSLNQCYWVAPVPADQNYKLNPMGQTHSTNFVTIPVGSNAAQVGGNFMNITIAGRLGCSTTQMCAVGDCTGAPPGTNVDSTGACTLSKGFLQPSSQDEINFFTGNLPPPAAESDTYDGENINGVSVPLSITPSATPGGGSNNNPYTCGVSGGQQPNPALGLGACSWNFNLSSFGINAPYYIWVTDGGTSCTTAAPSCASGQVCGLSNSAAQTGGNPPALSCGVFQGYWSTNQICSLNSSTSTPLFNCASNAGLPAGQTLLNLLQCSGNIFSSSCYSEGAQANQCCGCQNWQSSPTNLPVPGTNPPVEQCVASTSAWTTGVLPGLSPFKAACPSFYTYPYDDQTSTFTCNQPNSSGTNSTNYTVTFCPMGATGAP